MRIYHILVEDRNFRVSAVGFIPFLLLFSLIMHINLFFFFFGGEAFRRLPVMV